MKKVFTVNEVIKGLNCCSRNDCTECPFEDLSLYDCEVNMLRLAGQALERYEQENAGLKKTRNKKQKRRKNNDERA